MSRPGKDFPSLVAIEGYDPDALLDAVIDRMKLKNDAALSRALGSAPPVISKIRHRVLSMPTGLLIRIHENAGFTFQEMRELMKVGGARL